jgi:hypothetical protein
MNTETKIIAPRSLTILFIQYFGLCFLFAAIKLIFEENTSNAYFTILIGFTLVLSFIMLYFPQKYITRVIINKDRNVLEKVKKSQVLQKYELGSIKSFTSKRILARPDKYKLLVDKIDGSSDEIFNEYPCGKFGNNWECFAEKISVLTNKSLRKEMWQEDYDGKLSMISQEKAFQDNRKKGIFMFAVPLSISFLGAVYFKMFLSTKALIFAGLVTVLINISISFYYVLKNRKDFGKLSNNTFVLIIYVLTLLIPYFSFYILFVYLLNGFQLM